MTAPIHKLQNAFYRIIKKKNRHIAELERCFQKRNTYIESLRKQIRQLTKDRDKWKEFSDQQQKIIKRHDDLNYPDGEHKEN